MADPEAEWSGDGQLREQIREWTRQRGKTSRLYPGALVWCLKKPGRDLREKVELMLAWKRVEREVQDGTLGGEFEKGDRADLGTKVKDAAGDAKDEVWGEYRFAVVWDAHEADDLKVIDLGAGHSSSGETLCGRVIGALKSEALLNESVGAGYIERNWPPAFLEPGAWPLASLRQSFLDGSLTRLVDPDMILRGKIADFVSNGDFGLASGRRADGSYERWWFKDIVRTDEVAFEPDVFLLKKATAEALEAGAAHEPLPEPGPGAPQEPSPQPQPVGEPISASPQGPSVGPTTKSLRLAGPIPPEVWNRLGMKILPKLRSGSDLKVDVDFSVTVAAESVDQLAAELRQILDELGLADTLRLE